MPLVIDTKAYPLDAGEIEMLDGSSWVSLGATLDHNIFRVRQTKFRPVLNNVKGPVKGTERIVDEIGELEVSIPELSADRMALMVPGVEVTLSPITATGSGFTTTISAAADIGDTDITVASATGINVGEFLRLEAAGATAEYRKVTAVVSTTISLDRPLIRAHAAAATVTQTDGDGRSTITGSGSRIPDSAYHDFRLRVDSDNGLYDFIIKNALNVADATEMAMQRDGQPAPRLTLQSRYDPANTATRPWQMITPGVDS